MQSVNARMSQLESGISNINVWPSLYEASGKYLPHGHPFCAWAANPIKERVVLASFGNRAMRWPDYFASRFSHTLATRMFRSVGKSTRRAIWLLCSGGSFRLGEVHEDNA
jgi:hypothetical protein